MAKFRVCFKLPVTYLADSPLHRRVVTELIVNANTGREAEFHALRAVTGDPGDVCALPYTAPVTHPPVEVAV